MDWQTIIVFLILAAIIVWIIVKLITGRKKKRKSCCGCSFADSCFSKENDKKAERHCKHGE